MTDRDEGAIGCATLCGALAGGALGFALGWYAVPPVAGVADYVAGMAAYVGLSGIAGAAVARSNPGSDSGRLDGRHLGQQF